MYSIKCSLLLHIVWSVSVSVCLLDAVTITLLDLPLEEALFGGALFVQPVKHRWPCLEHIMAKWAGPSNAENNPNTNPNPSIYTATEVLRVAEIFSAFWGRILKHGRPTSRHGS